jgi:acetyl-CoA carboxylase biotin carboxylase subunit
MFKRILIANRGEIALRVIKACQKLGIESVAVYSQADAQSPHLKEATLSVCIGAGPSSASYLNQEAILQAAIQYECQAIHPGYGFLSENETFATRCRQQKTFLIGPSPKVLRLMGDKAQARKTMASYGVRGVPGSKDLVSNVEEALKIAQEIEYPILLKATAGGGGKGMRICRSAEDLPQAFEQASLEAQKAFGNAGLYMERFIEGGRHIEFQVLGDRYGHVICLGERECSTQRSNQKIIEESPSMGVSDAQRKELTAKITAILSDLKYEGAGTIELIRAPSAELFFMEMNTRLQVEHPVTEMVTGVDLVCEQIKIACGEPLRLKQEDLRFQGHAIECRINAEDPLQGFRPAPGLVTSFEAPQEWRYALQGPIRLDSHLESGYRVPTLYDSMLGKLIVKGNTRDEAIEMMKTALKTLKVEGVSTIIDLHLFLLDSAHFRSGQYHTPGMMAEMKNFVDTQTHSLK